MPLWPLTLLLALTSCRPRTTVTEARPIPGPAAGGWTTESGGHSVRPIPDSLGAAQLVVPAACLNTSCALVIVSHGWGARALDGVTHAPLDTLLDALDSRGFVLLLSNDGGPATWGNPAALAAVRRVYRAAQPFFQGDGRVYTLGVSMGGLPAVLTAYRESLGVPVRATAIIAGRVNLRDAAQTSINRARSIRQAYGGVVPRSHGPVGASGSFQAEEHHCSRSSVPRTRPSSVSTTVCSWPRWPGRQGHRCR